MLDKEKHIIILVGGPGGESEISLASGNCVLKALLNLGFRASIIHIKDGNFTLPDDTYLVFNLVHGVFGEDGFLQRILDKKGVRYTGACAKASECAFNKLKSKEIFLSSQIPVPRYQIFRKGDFVSASQKYPLVVKPLNQGSSIGVSLVEKEEALENALQKAYQYSSQVLVEEYIQGRELAVGVLGEEVLPIVEIKPEGGFYSIENKYPHIFGGKSQYFCPANLSAKLTEKVKQVALNSHRALDINVYSRVDILLKEEQPFVLEANTLPGMIESSLFPMAAKEAGYSFEQVCLRIMEISLKDK